MTNLWPVLMLIITLLLLAAVAYLLVLRKALKRQTTQNGLLQKAIQAASAGSFLYKVKTNETYWDENSLKMFGMAGTGTVIPPGTWEKMIHPDDRENALAEIFNVLNGREQLFTHVYRILLPSGDIRWIKGTGFVIRDDQRQPVEITGFHFDISGQIIAEQQLKDSEARARQAMQAKASFLANMSHEIRTPMNAIVGMIELLHHEQLNEIQRRYLSTLHNSSNVLLRIIDDILDVSKIEAGELSLEHKPMLIRQVLHQCLAVYTQASDRKNILLTGRVDTLVPDLIYGDSSRLQQVLMNLISNAFKFTEQGQILVRVSLSRDGNRLCISVEDSGVGIADKSQSQLFERFKQVDQSSSRPTGGTGLGLAIVREIVELWGGQVWLKSQVGQGSTFFFELPIESPIRTSEQAKQTYLLCTQQRSLETLWREDACAPELVTAFNPAELQRALATQTIDHLVIEPSFTSQSASQLIAELKHTHPNLRTTLIDFEAHLSGKRLSGDVDQFIAKPLMVNQIWEPSRWQAEAPQSEETLDFSHLKVLCVDDNQSNLIVLTGLLKRLGIAAVAVDSGAKAVETALAGDFDLILMDYEMPVMDGPSATRAILREKEQLVVALSAHTEEQFSQLAITAGMQGFLHKPIRLDALKMLLLSHFDATPSEPAVDP